MADAGGLLAEGTALSLYRRIAIPITPAMPKVAVANTQRSLSE